MPTIQQCLKYLYNEQGNIIRDKHSNKIKQVIKFKCLPKYIVRFKL